MSSLFQDKSLSVWIMFVFWITLQIKLHLGFHYARLQWSDHYTLLSDNVPLVFERKLFSVATNLFLS